MTPAKIQEQHPFSPARGSHTVSPSRRKLYRKSRKKVIAVESQPSVQHSLSESESDELPELVAHTTQVPRCSSRNGTQIHNEARQDSGRVEHKSNLSEGAVMKDEMEDGLGDELDPWNWEQNGNLGDNGNHYMVLPPISNRNDVDHLENGKNPPLQSNQNLSVNVKSTDSESQNFVRLLLSKDLHDRDEAFHKTVQEIKKMEKFKNSTEEEIRMRIQRDLDEAKALVVPIAAAGSYRSGRFEAVTRKPRRRSTSAMANENFFTGKEERAQPSSFSDGQGSTTTSTTSKPLMMMMKTTTRTTRTAMGEKKKKKKKSSNESKLGDRDSRARKPNETSPHAKRGQLENASDSKSKGSTQKENRNDPAHPRQAEQSELRMSPPKACNSGSPSSFMSPPRHSNLPSSVKSQADGSKVQSKKRTSKSRPIDAELQLENDFDLNDNQIGVAFSGLINEDDSIETEMKVEEVDAQIAKPAFSEGANFSSLFPLRPDHDEQSHYLNYGTTSTHTESAQNRDDDIMDFSQSKDDEEFPSNRGEFPAFARSHILTMDRQRNLDQGAERGGSIKKFVHSSTPDEAFKFSMLKASLDYDALGEDTLEAKGLMTHGMARRKAITSGGGDLTSAKNSQGSRPRKGPNFSTSSTLSQDSLGPRDSQGSLVRCVGPGSLKSYIDYVKDEGFVPPPIIDPEMGVEFGIFADKTAQGGSTYDPDSSYNSRSSSRIIRPHQGVNTTTEAHTSIAAQFESIRLKAEVAQHTIQEFKNKFPRKKRLSVQYEEIESLDLDVDGNDESGSGMTKPSRHPHQSRQSRSQKAGRLSHRGTKKASSNGSVKVNGDHSLDGGGPARVDGDDFDLMDTSTTTSGYHSNGGVEAGLLMGGSAGFMSNDPKTFNGTQLPLPGSRLSHSTYPDEEEGLNQSFFDESELTEDWRSDDLSFDRDSRLDYDDQNTILLQDALLGNNLLAMLEEPKAKFNQKDDDNFLGGESALDLFLDRSVDGVIGERHPALVRTIRDLQSQKQNRAEKLRVQEDLFRTKAFRKEAEMRREHLLNRAKMLQARANKHKAKLSQMWEDKFKDEFAKTGPLEVVCNALREELDAAHKERIQAFEIKMQPIIIRDGPSKKANYKIQAARLHYDIYALTQRLRHTTMRAEHEEQRRERKERMVRKLREEISEKKTAITTVTKGIPFNKIEVRPEDQIPQPSFHPLPSNNKPSTKIGPRKPVYHPATPSVAAGTLSAAQRQFSGAGLRQGLLPALPNGGFRGANTSKKEGGPGSPTKTLSRTQTIPTK
ncbi:uncharacterized protein LOC131886355 isoform X2 [Tigriopus californicus]|uniref:uncharacterized protein LOC131886355 isoform X2 n=1 Tax=Tigriopus californicus TaxID=6832 RepID=UPI0027DA7723|nr:uncharacterized protein LOC131886355 isoform X2 [Tigriopus californicus]